MSGVLGRFFFRSIAWLVILLPVWYWLAEFFAMPVAALAAWVMKMAFPYWVKGGLCEGKAVVLETWLRVTAPEGMGDRVAFLAPEIQFPVIGYGLPLFMALLFASGAKRRFFKLSVGALFLLPFQAFSLCLDWLKQIALGSGTEIANDIGMGDWQRELIALGYQFGVLAMPTLVPVILWLMLERGFIATLLLEKALADAGNKSDEKAV